MYLDDIRMPAKEFDFIVRSYDEAVAIIEQYGMPNYISFDNDLGVDEQGVLLKSGYDLAKWIIESDLDNKFSIPSDFSFDVHSQNPVGKTNIILLFRNYLKSQKNIQ
jgi:hypothetical protein